MTWRFFGLVASRGDSRGCPVVVVRCVGWNGGQLPRLLPDEKMLDYKRPERTIKRIEGEDPYLNWIQACKGGDAAASNFDYSGPFTEMVVFDNLALRPEQKMHWDNKKGMVTNVPNAVELVSKEYRKGWELPV